MDASVIIQTGSEPPAEQAPLLDPSETLLDRNLQLLETFLSFFGFQQSTFLSCFLSWVAFFFVGILVPALALKATYCSSCEKIQVIRFEIYILASQAALAAVSLLCISHNLRKHGIRKFLFVDRYHGQTARFGKVYVEKIRGFFLLILCWIIPCCLVKTAREIFRTVYIQNESWWATIGILVALVVAWTYSTTIFLSACSLFYLVCNLQVIHFEDYGKLLERESDVLTFLKEHMRLRHQLSKISHRFRIYLLLALLVVTASQFVTLLQTTGYHGAVNFINAGDFAVASIVQVVGIILCLTAAAKISHRAQGIGSVASAWHALLTCNTTDASQQRAMDNGENEEANSLVSLFATDSESDFESSDIAFSANVQLGAYLASYHKRQALDLILMGDISSTYSILVSRPGHTTGLHAYYWEIDVCPEESTQVGMSLQQIQIFEEFQIKPVGPSPHGLACWMLLEIFECMHACRHDPKLSRATNFPWSQDLALD